MKKTYLKPETIVVSLNVRDNVMIIASGGGEKLLGNGAGGTLNLPTEPGGDVFVDAREVIQSPDAWEEW
jgi:hypothetical protein